MKYKYIITGGTFDHLHSGHKKFLKYAFEISEKVLIGITSDLYVRKNKNADGIEKFEVRLRNLEHFLKTEKFFSRAKIAILNDIYGDEVLNKNFDSILVTSETLNGAKLINKARLKIGLKEVDIIIFDDILKNDIKISSTKIRNGQMDKSGELFFNELWLKINLNVPEKLKHLIREPLGELINPNDFNFAKIAPNKTISIGDETTKILNTKNINQKISVVDFKIKRQEIFSKFSELGFSRKEKIWEINNPPSQISKETWKTILSLKDNLSKLKRVILKVKGEEDLLVLPFIILFPLGFNIFYGQPDEGMVYIKINLNIKRKVFSFLKQLKATNY